MLTLETRVKPYRILLLFLVLAGAVTVLDAIAGDRAEAIHSALKPVLGEDNFRFQLTESKAGLAGVDELEKLVLVLNSESPSTQSVTKGELLDLLSWAMGSRLSPQQVFISRVPFSAGSVDSDGFALSWPLPINTGLLLILALLLALALIGLQFNRQPAETARFFGKPIWRPAEKEVDFRSELARLEQMAHEDPARVAQVIKEWVRVSD